MIQNYKRINFLKNILNIKKKKTQCRAYLAMLNHDYENIWERGCGWVPKKFKFFFTKI